MVEVVAVIGAGASGLVASRHLMRCGFRPFLFEQALPQNHPSLSPSSLRSGLGGAWNVRSGKFWDSLRPNLSRYTQCFSDFPWSHVMGPDDAEDCCYPTRAQVHEYLDRYAAEHGIRPRFGCKVTRVERNQKDEASTSPQPSGYRITWLESDTGTVQSASFDRVVVATGFFAEPAFPDCVHHLVTQGDSKFSVLHSSQYTSPFRFAHQTVAVVGSAFSALEICSDLAPHAQSVISIVPSVPWVLPRRIPFEDGSLPLDLALYRRKADAPQLQVVVLDEAACRARHQALQRLVGTRKQAAAIGIPDLDPSQPPTAVISDDYLDLVLSGRIQAVRGRLYEASRNKENGRLRIGIRDVASSVQSMEVDSIVCGTGYRSKLDFLDPGILKELEYDPDDSFLPLSLAHDAIHPNLPGLGFVGMYRGVFFGVMELQARLLAEMWSGAVQLDDGDVRQALEVSRRIRNHRPRAQFPQFDVVGCMDKLASMVGLVPPQPYGAKGMIVTPSYYQPSPLYSQQALEEMEREVARGKQGKDMPGIVLSALVGLWQFERTIEHHGGDARRETVRGKVRYSRAGPNLDAVRYREDGVFLLPNGREIDVFREYEYAVNRDDLEIYFVEEGARAHLFLGLQFQPQLREGCWEATSDHLCIKDLYRGTFQVYLDGISANKVIMTYRVKGPSKDYESVTVLTPLLG
jgi:cation diffusion facilitator CzcD-associated flavoprotein CzcO